MEMKKIAYIAVLAAASMSVAVATTASEAPASAPTPVPTSDAIISLPVVESLVGATILSFFSLYLH
ncbi:UNVERIFIED_CONTAM: hypothetical protein Slati_3663400 [Sesamum latifolium]|uniref:Arabinogalactan peptide 23-like n=1 Tax=Sesamum latifolium TaxID=2727402 RepID=A0AAW2U2J4_9LAMI